MRGQADARGNSMPHHADSTTVIVERAGCSDLLEVFGWLDRDPVANVYLLALVLRDGLGAPRDEYWVARRGGALAGLVCLGRSSGAILPVGDDPPALAALAGCVVERLSMLPRSYQVVGARAAVATVVTRLRAAGLAPRIEFPQTYMAVERGGLPPFERLAELRPARPEDYDLVNCTGAELRTEELEEDPRQAEPEDYARRVEEECRLGYTYLWLADGGLRFRASLSALTADAVQISGVFVPPGQRNRGHARRGLAELCTRLFARTRAACLFVNDSNAPAIAAYRRLGFRPCAPWASSFFDAPRGG
jgi:ribosomal protein S18 acetylase RimI-like enzyme